MRCRPIALVLAAACLLQACEADSPLEQRGGPGHIRRRINATVSLIRLIADPSKFAGRYVLTCGYVDLDGEPALYLCETDYRSAFVANSVPLVFGPCANFVTEWRPVRFDQALLLNKSPICVTGVFDATTSPPYLCGPERLIPKRRSADGQLVLTPPIVGD